MDSGPLPSACGSMLLSADSTLGPRSHHARPRPPTPQEGDASSCKGVHAGPAPTSSLPPCLEASARTHQPPVQTAGICQSSMGSRSARPPDRIPMARRPAVSVMVMEQDRPPPQSWLTDIGRMTDMGQIRQTQAGLPA
eukprot:3603597-Rhodomonas_salina.2